MVLFAVGQVTRTVGVAAADDDELVVDTTEEVDDTVTDTVDDAVNPVEADVDDRLAVDERVELTVLFDN